MKNKLFSARPDFSRVSILLIAILVIFINLNTKPWKKGRVIHDDIISYYCYLPAAIIHHDLTFAFTKANPDFYADKYWPLKTSDGREVVKMTMGLSVLYLPFFLVGHLIALIGGYTPDGYTIPYQILLQVSAVFYLILALIILRKLLRRWFASGVVSIVLFITVVGTNLLHYSTLEAPMSHVYNFFLFATFFYLTVRFWESPSVKYGVYLGALIGLISLVRPSNILITIFFLLWGVNSTKGFGQRFHFFLKNWKILILPVFVASIVWAPQLLYWKSATGHWLYYSYNNEGFFFLKPHILNGIFNYRKGWLTYSPVMIFPLIGILILGIKRKYEWFWPIVSFMLINIYIIFSWWSWWYGGGLGARPLIESYALLTLPFAYTVEWFSSKKTWRIVGYSALTVLATLGLTANFQYRYMAIHWDSMSKEAYWDSFLRLHPSGRLNYLLQEPDYESAIQGKNEIFAKPTYPPVNQRIIYQCSCDSLPSSQGGVVCSSKSHSGKNSLEVNRENQYGLSTAINLQPDKRYIAQVWRFGNPDAMLIVQKREANIYIKSNKTVEIDPAGWERLVVEFTTPATSDSIPYTVYVWNPDRRKAYFDDLTVGEALQ